MKESQCVEWKGSWNNEHLKWICGFANSQGGKLILGLNDDGSICGVDNAKKLLEDIPVKVRDVLGIMVDVNLLNLDNKDVVEIVVAPSGYPVNCRGEYHYRCGTTTQLLKGKQLTEFLLKKTEFRWDGQIEHLITFDNLEKESFDIFRNEALRNKRMTKEDLTCTNEELLDSLQLVNSEGYLTRAAVMTFYSKPEKVCFGCYTKIGYFEGPEILYQDEIHGSLLVQAEKVIEILYTKYFKSLVSSDYLNQIETYPYSIKAIKEAVYNALIHNNYSRGIPIQISVYKDRLYIGNNYNDFENWTKETLLQPHRAIPPNPAIANVFFRGGFTDAWGRGVKKICQACKESGNPLPEFYISDCSFVVRFDALKSVLIDTSNTLKLEGVEKEIFDVIKDNPYVTKKEIALQTEKNVKTISRYLRKMDGIVRYIGSVKSGMWVITNSNVIE